MALNQSDLSELPAALQATREMTDTIRSSLEWILQQLIEAEASAVIGAACERSLRFAFGDHANSRWGFGFLLA